MNDLLAMLILCFGEYEDIFTKNKISERNMIVEAIFESNKIKIAEYNQIKDVLERFPCRDIVRVELRNDIEDWVGIDNSPNFNCQSKFEEFIEELSETDVVYITIEIKKTVEDCKLSVYNLELFNTYLLSLPILDAFDFFEYNLKDNNFLIYELFNSDFLAATKTLTFKPSKSDFINNRFDRKAKLSNCKKASNFHSKIEIALLPDDFYFVVNNTNNPYKGLFDKMRTVLSIINISNFAELESDILKIQINGQRTQHYEYNVEQIHCNENLYDIYDWIYTEGNPIDKAMLARNLISLHCRYTTFIETDEKSFISIKSNYELYQRDNVDKYIEIKNKMTEFLSQLIDQSKEIVLDIMRQLEKNIFAFFTFMITVFLTNVISEKGLKGIFTKDVTMLTYLILSGSVIFIFITNIQVNYKVRKFKENYEAIKNNNSMFKDSKEFVDVFDDMKIKVIEDEIKTEKWKIYICWIAFIVLIMILIEILTDFGMFSNLFSKLTVPANQ